MINGSVITVCGTLTFDPVTRSTADGIGLTEIRIASNTRRRTKSGDWEDGATTYYRVTCWRRLGERVAESLHKGDSVVVVGRFQGGQWTDRDGGVHQSYEIDADVVGPDLNRVGATVRRGAPAALPVAGASAPQPEQSDPWAADLTQPASDAASEPAA